MVETFCWCLFCFFVCFQAARDHNQQAIDSKYVQLVITAKSSTHQWLIKLIKAGSRLTLRRQHYCNKNNLVAHRVGGRSTDIKTDLLLMLSDILQ